MEQNKNDGNTSALKQHYQAIKARPGIIYTPSIFGSRATYVLLPFYHIGIFKMFNSPPAKLQDHDPESV